MKIRNGFVSNSSSSSFIVAFPKLADDMSVEELKIVLFGDQDRLELYSGTYDTLDLAQTVYQDAKEQSPKRILGEVEETALDEMCSGYFDGMPERPWKQIYKLDKKERDIANEIYDATVEKTAKEKIKDFMLRVLRGDSAPEHIVVYSFCYSDNDGDYYATMEHGGIFDKLPHIRISHH